MILQESNGVLKTVPRIEFKTEKELQNLIEQNLEEIFGCRLVATEFHTGNVHSGRIDSLGLSEDGNPVIIEYKKVENSNLVTQGLFYLDWIKDHKGDFELAVQKSLKGASVDWAHIRVICIAPNFDRYSLHAVRYMGVGLELWQYHRYANGVLELEEVFRSSQAKSGKVKLPSATVPNGMKVDSEYSVEYHLQKSSEDVKRLFTLLNDFICELNPSVVAVPQKMYIAYKLAKNIACVEVLGKKLKIWLPLQHLPEMPVIAKNVSSIGHYGTGNLEVTFESESDSDAVFNLIREAYLSVGGD